MAEVEKYYWSIAEVSKMLNLPYSTLHYWEKEIKELKPDRNDGGTRFYTAQTIETLRQIKYMRDVEKMSIRMISKKFADVKSDVQKRQQMETYLKKLRESLLDLRACLQ